MLTHGRAASFLARPTIPRPATSRSSAASLRSCRQARSRLAALAAVLVGNAVGRGGISLADLEAAPGRIDAGVRDQGSAAILRCLKRYIAREIYPRLLSPASLGGR
jgi:hypothetical protein